MASEGLYPLSTQDGKAIPLDVIEPVTFLFWNLVDATEKSITVPTGFVLGYFYSTCDCIFRNANTTFGVLAEATLYTDAIFIPANAVITVKLTAGAGKIYPLDDGICYLTQVQQWAATIQSMQTSTQ